MCSYFQIFLGSKRGHFRTFTAVDWHQHLARFCFACVRVCVHVACVVEKQALWHNMVKFHDACVCVSFMDVTEQHVGIMHQFTFWQQNEHIFCDQGQNFELHEMKAPDSVQAGCMAAVSKSRFVVGSLYAV